MAEALELDPQDLPGLQEARRVEGLTDSRSRASRQYVARLQCEDRGQLLDHLPEGVDQFARVPVLSQFAIDPCPDAEPVRVEHFVGGRQPGTHRTGRVERLS